MLACARLTAKDSPSDDQDLSWKSHCKCRVFVYIGECQRECDRVGRRGVV